MLTEVANQTQRMSPQLKLETEMMLSAMSQLQASTSQVTENAQIANDAAAQAKSETSASINALTQSIQRIEQQASDMDSSAKVIDELVTSSSAISGVMDVIRSIAEQTNLLALNAAIEFAKAGEQGRRFAVVADEVRSLASRTQSSTEEIRDMIERLQRGSREASALMQRNKQTADDAVSDTQSAGEALRRSLDAVAKITALNLENAKTVLSASQQLQQALINMQ